MIKQRIVSFALIASLFSSCSSSLSKKDKSLLTAISIPAPTVEKRAYSDPASMTNSSAGTLGLVGGLAGGLIGGVVVAAVAGVKQSNFEGDNKVTFAAIKSFDPTSLSPVITRELNSQLATDAFFGPRLNAQGTSQLATIIARYSLQKIDSTRHSPAILLVCQIKSPSGKILTKVVGSGTANTVKSSEGANLTATIKDYAASPTLLKTHYEQASTRAIADLVKKLKKCVN